MQIVKFVAATFLLSLSVAHAQLDARWKPVTTKTLRTCDATNICRINQTNGSFEVKFVVSVSKGMQVLEKVQIRNLKTTKVQEFPIDAVNNLPEDEYFQLYTVQLRPGKERDLALLAFLSPREGEVFHYFIYDTANNQYVMNTETFPKLKHNKGSEYLSMQQAKPFTLGEDLKFK